eukprot:scaffold213643_cov31-Tisochrysis_lutea.AAC.6
MNCTPVASHSSQRPLSSSGVSIAPVGLAGDDSISPLIGDFPSAARTAWPAASSLAVTLYRSSTASVAVARVARGGHGDRVTDIEGCHEGDGEASRRARRQVDAAGRNIDVVVGLVHGGKRVAKGRLTARGRIAAPVAAQLLLCLTDRERGR